MVLDAGIKVDDVMNLKKPKILPEALPYLDTTGKLIKKEGNPSIEGSLNPTNFSGHSVHSEKSRVINIRLIFFHVHVLVVFLL